MTASPEPESIPPEFRDPRVQAWMEENLTDLRKSVTDQRILHQSLLIAFVVGMAAHIGGYMLLLSAPKEPLGLLADLLHAFGWSLWTGVVVVVFVQILPEAKRRQIRTVLESYEAFQREKARASRDPGPPIEEQRRE